MPQSDPPHDDRPPRLRWPWVLLSVGALLAVMTLLWDVEDTADVTQRAAQPPAPLVTVAKVDRQDTQASVSVFAELRPRWHAEIRARLGGGINARGRLTRGPTPLDQIGDLVWNVIVLAPECSSECSALQEPKPGLT